MPIDKDKTPTKGENFVKHWIGEIEDALAREKKFRTSAQKVVDLYEGKRSDETPYAIVYSNTEVLQPALYNARPIPIVTRRFKDEDPVGKATAETSTRLLKYMIDVQDEDYDDFDALMLPTVLDALLTNRGLSRFKYVAKEGQENYEHVCGESVRWDKFFHGYARTWKKVPWIGFEWDMSKEEIKKNFPGVDIDFRMLATSEDQNPENKAEDRDELAGVTTYKVYEIWDKRTKKVMFFSHCSKKSPLREVADPLKLINFFPVPKPMNFMAKVTTLVPTPLYEQYRQQAQELNDITVRLKAIIKAIRYRGAFNAAVEGIEKMLEAEDNKLVPVENVQSMPDGTSMDKLLWIVPVQELATTAQSLYQQRESCKQVIYEITGISDILRGASVASETATAQNIKNQWGTLRLKKMQKEVQRYCREALAIMLEIAAEKFDQQTIISMTGLPYLTEAQKQQINAQQQMQVARAAQMMPPPQPGQPPQQPQPPQLPPEVEARMKAPSWEVIMKVFKSDIVMSYKTDIETNSTIDAEAAQDKQDISELLNALSQFLNGIGPMIENGTMPFAIAKEMLLVISRRYNFGSQLEDILMSTKEPEQKPDPAEAAKAEEAKATSAANAAKSQADIAKAKMDMQRGTMEFQQEQALMAQKLKVAQAELAIKVQELDLQREMLQMKTIAAREQHRLKMEAMAAKAELDKQAANDKQAPKAEKSNA